MWLLGDSIVSILLHFGLIIQKYFFLKKCFRKMSLSKNIDTLLIFNKSNFCPDYMFIIKCIIYYFSNEMAWKFAQILSYRF